VSTAVQAATEVQPYRAFAVRVHRVRALSPCFVRITFAGPELGEFADIGADQRIKLVVPLPDCGVEHFPTGPEWYDEWRRLPETRRNPLRTYTVAAVRAEHGEVDVDIVAHPGGLAADWLCSGSVGATTVLLGPNARFPGEHGGVEWRPPTGTNRFLIVGDETAVPAVANIGAMLPPEARGQVILEVPQPADFLSLTVPPGISVTWLARHDAPQGRRMLIAVAEATTVLEDQPAKTEDVESAVEPDEEVLWEVPTEAAAVGGPYAWIAGEAGTVRELRRLLLSRGWSRDRVAFMGYWREGHAG